MPSPLRILSNGPDETQEVGRLLGQGAEAGDVFLLTGPLGAGKTCLTQGIAWGLGVPGYARSPTFVMIARYQGRLTLHHVDLFRAVGLEEAIDLGLEEYLSGEDVCVVEWADRAAEMFPPEAMRISLEYGEGETDRVITIHPATERHRRLLKGLPGAVEAGTPGDPPARGGR
jgi:tRNA threonylcarbamoyladenosine biosynthesis protein TsaE